MNEIFVKNTGPTPHTDSYDGQEFTFPAGEKVLIPMAAAVHMFGAGRKDKTENLVRLGWANLPDDEGAKRLARFVFTVPVMVEQEIEADSPSSSEPAAE